MHPHLYMIPLAVCIAGTTCVAVAMVRDLNSSTRQSVPRVLLNCLALLATLTATVFVAVLYLHKLNLL